MLAWFLVQLLKCIRFLCKNEIEQINFKGTAIILFPKKSKTGYLLSGNLK